MEALSIRDNNRELLDSDFPIIIPEDKDPGDYYKEQIRELPYALNKLEDWQVEAFECIAPIMLLTGSGGGGKSFCCALKLHFLAYTFPGATCVVLRKNRSIMTNSTVLFLQRGIIRPDIDSSIAFLPSKFRFEYPNGSIICYAGMDDEKQREHFKSIGQQGGIDFLWIEEATALEEADFDMCLSRMRGRAALWTQIMLSTNPDAPTHFIKSRLIDLFEAYIIYSSAKDNPHNPETYENTLQSMKGVMKQRMADGQWVAASGTVYGDVWVDKPTDPVSKRPTPFGESNVTYEAEYIPGYGDVEWACDDGYVGESDGKGYFTKESHPLVILLVQKRNDGILAVFAELVVIKTLHRQAIEQVIGNDDFNIPPFKDSEGDPIPLPKIAIVDKSASKFKGELDNYRIKWVNGAASVAESIKVTRAMLDKDNNGIRRVIVHPRCKAVRMEMVSYVWSDNGVDPEKWYDHTLDSLRYLCWYHRFEKVK